MDINIREHTIKDWQLLYPDMQPVPWHILSPFGLNVTVLEPRHGVDGMTATIFGIEASWVLESTPASPPAFLRVRPPGHLTGIGPRVSEWKRASSVVFDWSQAHEGRVVHVQAKAIYWHQAETPSPLVVSDPRDAPAAAIALKRRQVIVTGFREGLLDDLMDDMRSPL